MTARALFSIHDVMPETLGEVAALLDRFRAREMPLPALLVVPGKHWSASDLQLLGQWASEGAEFIAHGWEHYTEPKSLYHRAHGILLSRNVAEHLAYDSEGILALMERSHRWFSEHELPVPRSYVPPAWALGLSADRLTATPFDVVETLTGVYLRDESTFPLLKLPLVGFEADSALRAVFLSTWNTIQQNRAVRQNLPLRISIHPYDADLKLSHKIHAILTMDWEHLRYEELLGRTRERLAGVEC